MRNRILFCLLFACIVLQSCKKNENDKAAEAKLLEGEKTVSTACYQAFYEKDSLDLKINSLKNGKISGILVMSVADLPKRVGDIQGEFRGDTLFVDYSFKQGASDSKSFKNPMAFLKKGEELILGNGEIETTMGVTYFVKGKPIDFEKVKYKFTAVECKD